jgi:exodeoxyribonuclease-5
LGQAVQLSEEQARASAMIEDFLRPSNSKQTFVLHGLAGTGKTTVLAGVSRRHRDSVLCTLTGKAASVLQRKTGVDACTIHSAFYTIKEIQNKNGKRDIKWEQTHGAGSLRGGIILLDECSMVNEAMARDILATGAKVVACGDPGQLPPVSGRQFFDKPDFELKTIHRQALESPIIRQAHTVRKGGRYEADGDAFRVMREASDGDVHAADAILCWTNKTRAAANGYARQTRGLTSPLPQMGEPVMCLRNNRDLGIYNGAIYTLADDFAPRSAIMRLDIDGRIVDVPRSVFEGVVSPGGLAADQEGVTPFCFGYALTVHKAQGSEFSNLILMDEYRSAEHRDRWIYTGITRAADRILVLRA